MDPSSNPFLQPSLSLLLLLFSCCGFLVLVPQPIEAEAASDQYSDLVYKSCSNQKILKEYPVDSSYSQTPISSLLVILTENSRHSSFFKGGVLGDNDTHAVFGLFQCRGDLSSADCHNCVSRLPALSKTLCGRDYLGARIQLSGCYIQYLHNQADEINSEEAPPPDQKLLYKLCSSTTEAEEAMGSNEDMILRDEAFAAVQMGVMSSSNGFYHYHQEYSININGEANLMAQCQSDMGRCECGECVSDAVQVAMEECKSSVSGQIYMADCYLGFNFYSDRIMPSHPHHEKSAAKTVAILVGASAALVFGFLFLKLIKSWVKKDDDL